MMRFNNANQSFPEFPRLERLIGQSQIPIILQNDKAKNGLTVLVLCITHY